LINLIWVVSIVGFAATLTPFLALVWTKYIYPAIKFLVDLLTVMVIRFFLLIRPIYEPLVYFICFVFIVKGYFNFPPTTGFFIGLTGTVFAFPAVIFTGYMKSDYASFHVIYYYYPFFNVFPLAWTYESYVLGYISVFMLFSSLMNTFEDKRGDIEGATFASATITGIFVAAKIFGFSRYAIFKITVPAALLFGSFSYLCCCMISSLSFHYRFSISLRLSRFFISCLVFIFLGTIFNLPTLSNSAFTFLVLYLQLWILINIPRDNVFSFFLIILVASVFLWYTSKFLLAYPGWLVSLAFSSDF